MGGQLLVLWTPIHWGNDNYTATCRFSMETQWGRTKITFPMIFKSRKWDAVKKEPQVERSVTCG